MGVFTVSIRVRNWQKRCLASDERGADVACDALVDTGAVELCLPAELVEQLRLTQTRTLLGETADGTRHRLRVMGMTEVEVQGRTAVVEIVELPRGAMPLLGATPLQAMDWHISPREHRLVPNPRSPDGGPLIALY